MNILIVNQASLTKPQLEWAVDLTVKNLSTFIKIATLKTSKQKSLSNMATKFVLAFLNGNPIGFIAYRLEKKVKFIYEIHVEYQHRQKGIGKALLDECKKISNEIWLQVHVKNEIALRFYEKNGFELAEQAEPNYFVMRYINNNNESV